jgi:uncharacterized protein (TIGR02246 family)
MDTNPSNDADVAAIKKLGQDYFDAANAGDPDRSAATMAPDVIIMPPDRLPLVGKEEIRRLAHHYHATFEMKYTLNYDEVETAGDWGFARATVTGTRTSKSGGGVEHVSLKNLWIFKKQGDGMWKFWRIMFNSTGSPQNS